MGDVQTGSQTSGLTNPAMKAAATTIGNQLNTQLKAGVKPYTGSLAPDLSSQTKYGLGSIMGAAGNTGGLTAANDWARGTVGAGGYNPALSRAQSGVQSYVNAASADNPLYQAQKQQLIDDVTQNTNAAFNASGRFGGQANYEGLSQGLSSGLIGLESDRLNRQMAGNQALAGIGQTAFTNAAGAAASLPGFYQAGLMPGQAQLQVGQVIDANNLSQAQDAARLQDATQNAGWNTLQRGSAIFAGTAPVSGTQTSQSQPWWKVGTGLAATGLGFL